MGRRRILAGNWKMNKTRSDLTQFFERFHQLLLQGNAASVDQESLPEIIFAMPFTLLADGVKASLRAPLKVAAQNIHWADSGAYTGEISALMLLDIGVSWTLIGHSERRQFFAETDETVGKKVKQALCHNITPIVCVGETLEERESGATESVVTKQISGLFSQLQNESSQILEKIVIAYEPVWAIGTGRAASSLDAQNVHKFIRSELAKKFGANQAEKVRILYGGSASPKNIDELLSCPDIDGGLVGGASLLPEDFAKMVMAAVKAK